MKKQSTSLQVRLPVFVFITEVIIVALYAAFVTYDEEADAKFQTNQTNPMQNAVYRDYPFFTDIHFMIFVGFGCLLAFFPILWFWGDGFQLPHSYFCHPVGHSGAGLLPVQL